MSHTQQAQSKQSPLKQSCILNHMPNPFECHTIHRDVQELRTDYKEILKMLTVLERNIAINTTKSAVISSIVTTTICGIVVGLGTKILSLWRI